MSLYIRAGRVLEQLSSTSEVSPLSTVASLAAIGFVSLLPVLFKERLRARMEA